MKDAKQKWINDQCEEIEHSIATNNTKKGYQLVKTLTKQQQLKTKSTTSKTRMGNALPKEKTQRKDGQSAAQNCTLFRT